MKQISLDSLRIFVIIVEQGGFARAGDIVGRSQPAISLQMKKLESQLGRSLFNKEGQRYVANSQGRWLYEKAKQMLALSDDIFSHMNQESLSGQIRLGIPSEFASLLLPSLIGEFAKQYPDISLVVTSNLSRNLLDENHRKDFDVILALVEDKQAFSSLSTAKHWVSDPLVWVGDSHHLPDPQHINLVLAANGCVYRSRVIHALKQQTLPWRITYTNSDLGGLSAAMQQGLGITALAKRSVPDNLQVLRHRFLPQLGNIHIGLFDNVSANSSKRQADISQTLVSFLASRLMVDA
jgi:DNA-binding transcriptional LysR family regulator